ncbi:MAG: hypothetical protein O2931_09890, partial [Planctomycetota bacterium]|nr:hypothetical protein [Planctomycetota bacterium]
TDNQLHFTPPRLDSNLVRNQPCNRMWPRLYHDDPKPAIGIRPAEPGKKRLEIALQLANLLEFRILRLPKSTDR